MPRKTQNTAVAEIQEITAAEPTKEPQGEVSEDEDNIPDDNEYSEEDLEGDTFLEDEALPEDAMDKDAFPEDAMDEDTFPEDEVLPEENTADEDIERKLTAVTHILYHSKQYKPGDTLPANDPLMVSAWTEAGTAEWKEKREAGIRAESMTAQAGLAGYAVPASGNDLIGRIPAAPKRFGRSGKTK